MPEKMINQHNKAATEEERIKKENRDREKKNKIRLKYSQVCGKNVTRFNVITEPKCS